VLGDIAFQKNGNFLAFCDAFVNILYNMAFNEEIKLKVKRHAHFKCCMCQRPYVEVHHIIPQSDEGEDTEENAAPLCPWCHEIHGNDPTKRKYIREARDAWYEICAKRYSSDPDRIDKITAQLNEKASKEDLKNAVAQIHDLFVSIINQPNRTTKEVVQEISDVTAAISDLTVLAYHYCGYCGITIEGYGPTICPHCGHPSNINTGT
jgi:ribosomal protein L23